MVYTYNDCKTARSEISDGILQNKKRVQQAAATINTAVGELGAMTARYTPFIDTINADAAANLTNPAYQLAQADAAEMVTEYLTLLAKAQAIQAAIAAVG